ESISLVSRPPPFVGFPVRETCATFDRMPRPLPPVGPQSSRKAVSRRRSADYHQTGGNRPSRGPSWADRNTAHLPANRLVGLDPAERSARCWVKAGLSASPVGAADDP